ncbi:MAG: hypothetical protein Q9173_004864 [Seirophora scorigena]
MVNSEMLTKINDTCAMNGINGFCRDAPGNRTANGQEAMDEENISPELEATETDGKSNTSYPQPRLNGIGGNGNTRKSSTDNRRNGTGVGRHVDFDLADMADEHGESPPPVAIVGMGMRLPGGVSDESAFWELLVNKKNGQSLVPDDRYNIEAFYDPDGGPGTVKSKYGYFLDQVNLQHLDTSFFSMNRSEVERLDPQQRLLLEVVWECMENGGQLGWRGKKIGCYVGVFGEDWLDMAAKDTQHLGMYRIAGSGDFAVSNRISYEYDLKGPSITIRTACSSSLIGLHEACQAIYQGECDSALVAGTNLIMTPSMTIAMTEQGVLSPTGSCKSFDANADGYARGEAINAVYIKKLSDALREGDPVRAVIRATATNCDGKTPGMACPSSESHEAVMRRAYRVAQLHDLSATAFMECHGTGTAIGDPLETAAIANVFGPSGGGLFIGSVKPNIGHAEGASGTSSLIKTVLALEHKIIPPNINFHIPNPKIPFEKARLQVPVEVTPWPHGRERASVNSFGIGGANAHVVVDSAASFGIKPVAEVQKPLTVGRPHLLVFSANHPSSLNQSIANYQQVLASRLHSLEDVAYTLGARREHLPHRAFAVTDGKGALETSTVVKTRSPSQVIFVFTGQGAQWAGMAEQLMLDFAEFRDDIKMMDQVLAGLPIPPVWTIEEELAGGNNTGRIDEAEFSQPLCTAVQVALVNLLKSWGISPAAVVGHSSGEIAAAYASNAISAQSAIVVAYYRGQASRKQIRPGGMLAVGMGREAVTPYLTEGLVVACENSPQSVTLSGDRKQINRVAQTITDENPEIFIRHLKVAVAYHSNHMKDIGDAYLAFLHGHVPTNPMKIPFFSSVSGGLMLDERQLGPSYWQRNLESPVRFYSAVRAILDQASPGTIFLEVGPHAALSGPLKQTFKALAGDKKPVYVPSLVRGGNNTANLLTALGQLHLLNVPIKFEALCAGKKAPLTNLPTYLWHHETDFWNESRVTRDWRMRKFPKHELLGCRILEDNNLEPAWRNVFCLEDVPWLQDHKVIDDIVFPAAGYVAMAGESVRQLTGREDFTLRNVFIKTALVLQHSKTIEMMTNLRQVRLTTVLDSDWYEFTISSSQGTSWVRHCMGQVKAGGENPSELEEEISTLPREVPATAWYAAMKFLGLNYGPAFQKMTDMTAGPQCNTAVASFSDHRLPGDAAIYQVHPTAIDACLQLFTVGMAEGITRRLQKLCVPTEFEELYIRRRDPHIRAKVTTTSSTKSTLGGDAVATAGGEVVIRLKGGRFSPLENQISTLMDDDSIAGARLKWMPDIDFMQAHELMRPRQSLKGNIVQIERLSLLCILETRRELLHVTTEVNHLRKFQTWLDEQADRADRGTYPLIEDAQTLARMGHKERRACIELTSAEMEQSVAGETAKMLLRILDQCTAIFAEQVDPVDILLQENGLKSLYDFFQDMWDCRRFFALLGHAKPNLRILEIGAGTGGTTASVLGDLATASGQRLYSEYCYTDISPGFFVAAKERFKDFQNIRYAVLDISKDPIEQGFEAGAYDLILASNGILPGWWLGENDDRPNEPFITAERWDKELRIAGFSGTDSVVYDNDFPHQVNANIISRPANATTYSKRLTLLCGQGVSTTAGQVETLLLRNGFHVEFCNIDDPPPPNQDIISLMDLDGPFFDDISSDRLAAFQRYVGSMNAAGILWITRSSQIDCQDPRYSQVLGIARTCRSELLLDFATFEIDSVDDCALQAIVDVFTKFQRRNKDAEIDPEWEFALSEGVIYTSRYQWDSVIKELSTVSDVELPRKLQIGKSGLLQTLQWVQADPITLAKEQIEVEPCAVGLNFKDILVCMGLVDAAKDGIGLEAAGVVRNIGTDVEHFKVGDRVIIFEHGCFSTRMAISAKLCAKIPDQLSFEEAATLPCIFATVGNDEKRQYLVQTVGIPHDRIFNSRNDSFLTDVKRATNGRGVDVVLNSLSGELLHASWKCVAEYGKMLEIGKRDFIGRGLLSMELFEANRAFFGIDLARLGVERPEACKLQGKIAPIQPMKVFEAAHIVDAFKYMQKGQHIGKIVVTMPGNPKELSMTAIKRELQLRPEASYLLVGGLGGLGRAIATWMVEHGARHLIFLSRSAGLSDQDDKFFHELHIQGCSVQACRGSVTEIDEVKSVVNNATAPIAGVMHMSMVLKDRGFLDFTHDEWKAAVAPKVKGAWNLHQALLGQQLDFFVLFSSISAIVGQWGQGNYAAANTFLDSFVQYRQSRGLPASAINIGVMGDVGYVSQNPAVLEQLKAASAHTLREQDLMDTLQLVIGKSAAEPWSGEDYSNRNQWVIGLRSTKPLSDPSNRAIWKRDIRMSAYRNLESLTVSGSAMENESLGQFLLAVAKESSMLTEPSNADFLTREIGRRLCDFMLRSEEDLDMKQPLAALGVDSLVAIEIRNWWRQSLGLEISVLEIMNAESIEQLGKHALEGLRSRYQVLQESKSSGDTYLLMKAP